MIPLGAKAKDPAPRSDSAIIMPLKMKSFSPTLTFSPRDTSSNLAKRSSSQISLGLGGDL